MMSLDYQGTWSASDHTRTSENVHSLWLNGLLGGSGNDLSNQWSFDPNGTMTVTSTTGPTELNATAILTGTLVNSFNSDYILDVSVNYTAADPVDANNPDKIKSIGQASIDAAPEWALWEMDESTVQLSGTAMSALDGLLIQLTNHPSEEITTNNPFVKLYGQMGEAANDKNTNPSEFEIGFSNWVYWDVVAGVDGIIDTGDNGVGDFNMNLLKVGGGGDFENVPEVSAAGSLAAFASLLGLMALIRERRVGAPRRL